MSAAHTMLTLITSLYSVERQVVKKVCEIGFLRVPQAAGLYCSCCAAQTSKENFQKTFYKTFFTTWRPDCKSTKWNLHTRHVSKLKKVRPIRTPRSLLCSCVRYGSPTRPVGRSVTERIDRAGKTSVFCPRESRFLHEEETEREREREREREKWDSIA